ncbi:MAG: hypothetical protein AAGM40_25525 [Cyanobacteria bacterium J06573_2]
MNHYLFTYYLLLATCYSLLATHYSLLTTQLLVPKDKLQTIIVEIGIIKSLVVAKMAAQ